MTKNKIKTGIITLFAGMNFLIINGIFANLSYAGDIMVIGNKDVPVSELSINEIRSIFLGEKVKWNNDQAITFVILKTDLHDAFLKEYVGNTASQYRNYWRKMVFTGKSKSPKSFNTPEELIGYISDTRGAIGYIPSEAYQDKVKTISVK